MNHDGPVKGRGSEDYSELWMGPAHGPDGTSMALQCRSVGVGIAVYIVDLYRSIYFGYKQFRVALA